MRAKAIGTTLKNNLIKFLTLAGWVWTIPFSDGTKPIRAIILKGIAWANKDTNLGMKAEHTVNIPSFLFPVKNSS